MFLVISCLLVVREASLSFGGSSVIVASGSCCVAAKDSGVPPLVALGIGVPQSLQSAVGLFSRCCVQAHLSLWLTVNTLF